MIRYSGCVGTILGLALFDAADVVLAFGSIRFDANCSESSTLENFHFLDHLACGQGWGAVGKVTQDEADENWLTKS